MTKGNITDVHNYVYTRDGHLPNLLVGKNASDWVVFYIGENPLEREQVHFGSTTKNQAETIHVKAWDLVRVRYLTTAVQLVRAAYNLHVRDGHNIMDVQLALENWARFKNPVRESAECWRVDHTHDAYTDYIAYGQSDHFTIYGVFENSLPNVVGHVVLKGHMWDRATWEVEPYELGD